MENIFKSSKAKIYGDGWKEVERRDFNRDEKKMIAKAEVTQGNYGLSCCFFIKGGGQVYYGFTKASQDYVKEGTTYSLDELDIVELERNGETITKVEPKDM